MHSGLFFPDTNAFKENKNNIIELPVDPDDPPFFDEKNFQP